MLEAENVIQTVAVADMKVSTSRDDVLITYALGSCLGISAYDPVACVGGMLHVMLPLSTINPARAEENPYTFVDTGVPRLFIECYKAGARKDRMVIRVAGGANTRGNESSDFFEIGKRNFTILRKLLWKNDVQLHAQEVGGGDTRTMSMSMATGEVTLKINGTLTKIL
jgi:chemotaxis protein CheD